ncbi:MAG: hypothetical protein IE927_07495 [Rhodobacterales bacterium]|nr:hypothetical protein [Rhodobacterales bacterium]
MTNRIKYLALAGSVALLAGCGGGGTGGGGVTAGYAAMETAARDLADGYIDPDTGALEAAARTSLPAAGTASYTGHVGGEVDGAGSDRRTGAERGVRAW